jgi:hypothetical protein
MKPCKIVLLVSDDLTYKNTGLLFPILDKKAKLSDNGFDINIIFNEPDKVEECDRLLVADTVYTSAENDHRLLEDLSKFRQIADKVLWVDTTDSSTVQTYAQLAPEVQSQIIPNVDRYLKKQLLADRQMYLSPIYESRLYTDHYIDHAGHEENPSDRHIQVTKQSHLEKLDLWWNIGLNPRIPFIGDIAEYYPKLVNIYEPIGRYLPFDAVSNLSPMWAAPGRPRPISVSGRFSSSFDSEAIEHHRKSMIRGLDRTIDTEKVAPKRYWTEIRNSKILLSPFGWGEICHRDFEGFMSGCIVVKPRMDHLVTWPPFFEEGETIITVDWEMDDLSRKVDDILDNYDEYVSVAQRGQSRFKEYYSSERAGDILVGRFTYMMEFS